MKKHILTIFCTFLISSCSFFNDEHIMLPMASNPSGANIYIDNKLYGKTPSNIKIVPKKNYTATFVKPGYGSASVPLEVWASVRGHRGGNDNTRCVLDVLTLPITMYFSSKCWDFKKKGYFVNIPNNAGPIGDDHSSIDARDPKNNGLNPYAIENNDNYGGSNYDDPLSGSYAY